MASKGYDTTIVRAAGNILSGMYGRIDDFQDFQDRVLDDLTEFDYRAIIWAVKVARAIVTEVKRTEPDEAVGAVPWHGVRCPKTPHHAWSSYVHGSADDVPYNLDGVLYCGRCHAVL